MDWEGALNGLFPMARAVSRRPSGHSLLGNFGATYRLHLLSRWSSFFSASSQPPPTLMAIKFHEKASGHTFMSYHCFQSSLPLWTNHQSWKSVRRFVSWSFEPDMHLVSSCTHQHYNRCIRQIPTFIMLRANYIGIACWQQVYHLRLVKRQFLTEYTPIHTDSSNARSNVQILCSLILSVDLSLALPLCQTRGMLVSRLCIPFVKGRIAHRLWRHSFATQRKKYGNPGLKGVSKTSLPMPPGYLLSVRYTDKDLLAGFQYKAK